MRNKSLTPTVKSYYQEAFLQKQLLILHILCVSGHQIPKQGKSSQITTGLGKKKPLPTEALVWQAKNSNCPVFHTSRFWDAAKYLLSGMQRGRHSSFSAFPRVQFKHFLWHYQKCSSAPSHVSAVWPIPWMAWEILCSHWRLALLLSHSSVLQEV